MAVADGGEIVIQHLGRCVDREAGGDGIGFRDDSRHHVRFLVYENQPMAAGGRHGLVFVDEETHMVTRIVAEADSIPSGFPVDASAQVLDYDFASVGDRQYLLPLRANLRIASGQLRFRNLIEFRDYRKFTGESKISFEDPIDPF